MAADRLRPLVLGHARPRDRSERDVLGYRRAWNEIHNSFRDGNGRVSRLLTLLALYQHGHDAGRYISRERLVEESKEDYYEVLNRSS